MNYNQPIAFTLGGFTVGHAATMTRCSAVGTIVGVEDREGRRVVTVEFDEAQPVDAPEGATSRRFELTHTNITATWEKPDDDGKAPSSAERILPSANNSAHPDMTKPVRWLLCTCCGGRFKGRQFHNQDTGHGLGDCCVEYVKPRVEDLERTYGISGVHYNVASQEK